MAGAFCVVLAVAVIGCGSSDDGEQAQQPAAATEAKSLTEAFGSYAHATATREQVEDVDIAALIDDAKNQLRVELAQPIAEFCNQLAHGDATHADLIAATRRTTQALSGQPAESDEATPAEPRTRDGEGATTESQQPPAQETSRSAAKTGR